MVWKVDYLLSDELTYELKARGQVPKKTVVDRRKQLRDVLRDEITIKPIDEAEVQGEVDACTKKMEEWEGRLEEWRVEAPRGAERQRLRVRLEHLQGRLRRVQDSDKIKEADGEGWFASALVEVAGLLDILKEEGTDSEKTDKGDGDKVEPLKKLPEVPTPLFQLKESRDSKAPTASSACASTGVENSQSPQPYTSTPLSQPSCAGYHKLPNPLEPILRTLPVVDGSDLEGLLNFFANVLKMDRMNGAGRGNLIPILMPYCQGTLGAILNGVVGRGGTLKDFHEEALGFYLPGRIRQQLIAERVYRLQRDDESLAQFVGSVRKTAEVLRLPLNDQDLFQAIMEGLSPLERGRLAMSPRPTNLRELENLFSISHNFQAADRQRRAKTAISEVTRGGLPRQDKGLCAMVEGTRPPLTEERRHHPGTYGRSMRDVVCYGCGEKGHIRRWCPRNKATRYVPRVQDQSKNPPAGGVSS
jgi:hypothetical protein